MKWDFFEEEEDERQLFSDFKWSALCVLSRLYTGASQ